MALTNSQFTLSFPDGWKETTVHTFEGPNESGVQHNLVLTIVPDLDTDLEVSRFARDSVRDSSNVLPGFEMINETEGQLPSGNKVFMLVYRYTPAENLTFFQKQYYMINDGRGYIFTATFSKKTLKMLSGEIDKIVFSLNIPEQE